ncbi:phosphomannomutase [Pseudoalteromonas luteoviolacea]|uniref:Phosphomannomutase n=1 Tax=Pseudoalteromonas luteoviolacea S4054 TaxID=1129367 RepID=A0A0F6ACP0_9GAMM|nr:phosphomannomutase [Pseudoalteromonas luteoviolacea]AOT09714.1 phosphomannomutase [Pseudoalteromonas luteoviolacea]AOT14627.1 phosphomannomutase [Pseudoalteromonas luteoviolacea]AOT19541.1 phosphomannomutase [Pseudoalteromonas luteoviolacea]KKE83982.1 hypothetical protein N479_11255 [Pseudoalteromonas luteoviolacea S4054]KZN77376.1 hypothetical protein N481_04795 [Pseudoalteromonas luteoviolacea S4047-1]
MNTRTIIKDSGISFGTSGARGLVTDFSPEVCAAFSIAFIDSISEQFSVDTVAIAIDNRPSSLEIAKACAAGLKQLNVNVVFYGVLPTPALAYTAMKDGMPSIMVTGSHIPFDRNGLKFYRPDGEITKQDELSIISSDVEFSAINTANMALETSSRAKDLYVSRYTSMFNSTTLSGKKIGIYEHSSAGRDIYKALFEQLGGEVISLGRSDQFIPIDTEAVSDEDKERAKSWVSQHNLDMLFSTDGDGDRPLVAGEDGIWLKGDILGLLCSHALNIEALATPVSCNTAIELAGSFEEVTRTKIGSPYVIEAFSKLESKYKRIAGFEANGGYLLATSIEVNNKLLTALPTRDAILPALILISQDKPISRLQESLPQRFTASDRLKNFATEKSKLLISEFSEDPNKLLEKMDLANMRVDKTCLIDGLRLSLDSGDIIHLRPSGNAPELRCYVESNSPQVSELYLESFLKAFGGTS